ncbi:MAG: BACON domain-containing protein [Mangrovibacterium sp.]
MNKIAPWILVIIAIIISCSKSEDPALNLSIERSNFDSLGGSCILKITSNNLWKANVDKGIEWITISTTNGSPEDNEVKITIAPNPSIATRSGQIKIQSEELIQTVTLNQSGAQATISLDKTTQSVSSAAGSFTLNVTTNGSEWTTSGVADWISLTPSSGNGSKTITVNYQSNPNAVGKEAVITFTSGASTKTLIVTQAAAQATISLDKTTQSVSSAAGSFTLNVTTNGSEWTTSGAADWISLTPSSGTGSKTITVNYQKNSTLEGRKSQIVFSVGKESKTLTITQSTQVDPNEGGEW